MRTMIRVRALAILVASTTLAAFSMESWAGSPKRTRSSRAAARVSHRSSHKATRTAVRRSSHRSRSRTLAAHSSSRLARRVGRARSSPRSSAHRSGRRVSQRRTSRRPRTAARTSPTRSARPAATPTGRSAHSPRANGFQRSGPAHHTGSSRSPRTSSARAPRSSGHTLGHGSTRLSNTRHRPSVGLTIGGIGNHYAGYIQLGNHSSDAGLHGALYYNGSRRHHNRHHGYSLGHYYHHYRPIHYYGYNYYRPFYGYTYLSAYCSDPYVYSFYDANVYYVDQTVAQGDAYGPTPSPPAGATPSTSAQDKTYQALTEPGDTTLVGQGNTAFTAGRYDEARRFYVSAMLADERDGYAKFLYALANFAAGDYDVAGMALRRALVTTPALIAYPVDVRSLYRHPFLLETQLEDLIRFVDGHADDRGALLLLGYLHYASGRPERALPVVNRLSESDTDDSVAALLRDAIVRVGQGKKPGD